MGPPNKPARPGLLGTGIAGGAAVSGGAGGRAGNFHPNPGQPPIPGRRFARLEVAGDLLNERKQPPDVFSLGCGTVHRVQGFRHAIQETLALGIGNLLAEARDDRAVASDELPHPFRRRISL